MSARGGKTKAVKRPDLSKDFYEILVGHTSDIIFLRDKKGVLLYVTPSIKTNLGYDPEDLIGKPTWGFVHQDDGEKVREWKETVLEKEKPYHSVARMQAKNGDFVWLDTKTEIIRDEKGRFKYILSTSRNIQEQKKQEEGRLQLQNIIEEALNEVCIIDPKTLKFSYCNNKILANLGFTREEFIKMGPQDIAGKTSKKYFQDLFAPLLDGRKQKILFEGTNRRKDGSIYNAEISLQAVKSNSKKLIVAVIEDITEKKNAREQLYQAQKMEVVGQLTGGIAHNFNNLLTAILGSLRLLEKQEPEPEKKEMLQLAIRSTKRGAELTHRLLAFARKQHLAPQVVNIGKILEEVDSLLVFALGGGIDIKTGKIKDPLFVRVDPGEFENALLNLAINARDAMPKGGTLTVVAKRESLKPGPAAALDLIPGTYVITEVADNGAGMDPEVLDKALEPFFTTKGVGEGSGLGLSMVYGFAKQSGGGLEIKSEKGKGTLVRIFLPSEE